MKKEFGILAVCLVLVAGLVTGVYGAAPVAGNGAGETPLERYCTDCHGLGRIESQKIPAVKWWLTIRRMATFDGFDLDTAQQKEVFEYLKQHLAIDGPGGRDESLEKSLEKSLKE